MSEQSVDQQLDEISFERYVDLWSDFIVKFKKRQAEESGDETAPAPHYYFDYLQKMEAGGITTFTFDYDDLRDALSLEPLDYEDHRILEQLVLRKPDDARMTLTDAVLSVLREFNESYSNYLKNNKFKAEFSNIPISLEIGQIGSDSIGLFVKVQAVLVEYDENRRIKYHKKIWKCDEGHLTESSEFARPRQCSGIFPGMFEAVDCNRTALKLDHQRTAQFTEDQIKLKLQQRADKTPEGKRSPEIVVDVLGKEKVDMVMNELFFGQLLEINGVVRMREYAVNKQSQLEGTTDLYLEASSIKVKPDSALAEEDNTTSEYREIVKKAVLPESEQQDYAKLVRSVAPYIWLPEGDIVKEAILLLLVGSDTKYQPDGSRTRGSIEMLFPGDPSIAKSTIAMWCSQVKRRSIYNTGEQSSDVGLLGGMHKGTDGYSKIFPGAIELANHSLCIIDELGDRTEKQQRALVQAMADNQRITIRKGGEQRDREIDVSFLCITNPSTPNMRYNVNWPFHENVKNIIPKLISRFDITLVMRDIYDENHDTQKIQTIMKGISRSVTAQQFKKGEHDFRKLAGDDFYPIPYMTAWIDHVQEYHPRFSDSEEAKQELESFYKTYRKLFIKMSPGSSTKMVVGEDVEVPVIDLRKAPAFIRLAEARARACHRNYVTKEDAKVARKLLEVSLAVMGFNPYLKQPKPEIKQEEDNMAWLTRMARKPMSAEQKFIVKQYKSFNEELDRISWQKCQNRVNDVRCNGTGFIPRFLGEAPEKCEVCDGVGVTKISFDKAELEKSLRDKGVNPTNFLIMWKNYEESGLIVKDKTFPNLYASTRSHIDYYDKNYFGDKLRPVTPQQDDPDKKQNEWSLSVIEQNPELWQKLNDAVREKEAQQGQKGTGDDSSIDE